MATINLYKTYSFRTKDPVIDRLRTLIADEKVTETEIHNRSNVSKATLAGWFRGKTRRPQFATVAAVAGALGYEYRLIRASNAVIDMPERAAARKASTR